MSCHSVQYYSKVNLCELTSCVISLPVIKKKSGTWSDLSKKSSPSKITTDIIILPVIKKSLQDNFLKAKYGGIVITKVRIPLKKKKKKNMEGSTCHSLDSKKKKCLQRWWHGVYITRLLCFWYILFEKMPQRAIWEQLVWQQLLSSGNLLLQIFDVTGQLFSARLQKKIRFFQRRAEFNHWSIWFKSINHSFLEAYNKFNDLLVRGST